MNLLDYFFEVFTFRLSTIEKVIAWLLRIKLLLTKEESLVGFFDEIIEARVINRVVQVRVYPSFVINIQKTEQISLLDHN